MPGEEGLNSAAILPANIVLLEGQSGDCFPGGDALAKLLW